MPAVLRQATGTKRSRFQMQARAVVRSADELLLLSMGLKTVEDFWFDVDLCTLRSRSDAEKAVQFFSASRDFEYRVVRGSRV